MTTKHYIVDIDYLNDVACNIADNVPKEHYEKFLRELSEYIRCCILSGSESESDSESSEGEFEEVCEVEVDANGFLSIATEEVKDCDAVGNHK
tara:strand:+ start:9652 stop:9930 length:279 start_codon:yes stop_codon:yes gene_type:complete